MINQSAQKQLFYEYINSGITLVSGFLSSFIILFWLKEELFAQYALVISIISILNILTSFGLYNYAVQFVKHQKKDANSILTDAMLVVELISFTLTVIIFVIISRENLSQFQI